MAMSKDHYIAPDGTSFHRRAEFGGCWVDDLAFDNYCKAQADRFNARLKQRNESRRRRHVKPISPREAARRAERYQESLRLEIAFCDYIRWKLYKRENLMLALEPRD